tara:strand:- start:261 stop:398 length:138 start_codon:yes stop_codon:yes gene_type:complete
MLKDRYNHSLRPFGRSFVYQQISAPGDWKEMKTHQKATINIPCKR